MISNFFVLATLLLAPLYVVRFNIGLLPTTLLEVLIAASVLSFVVEEAVHGQLGRYRTALTSPFSGLALALLLVSLLAVFVSPTQYQALGLWRAYFLEPIVFFFVLLAKFRAGVGRPILA